MDAFDEKLVSGLCGGLLALFDFVAVSIRISFGFASDVRESSCNWDCDSLPSSPCLSVRTWSVRSVRGGAVGGNDDEATVEGTRFEGLGGVSTPVSGRSVVVADDRVSRRFSLSLMWIGSPRGREAAISIDSG
jgi:hypothetical protein